jgi:hypothetical protein
VARDATTGSRADDHAVSNLPAFATGATGVGFEPASPAPHDQRRPGRSGNAPTTVTTFTGLGPDRTELAFLGPVSGTARGAGLASQDHLLLFGA